MIKKNLLVIPFLLISIFTSYNFVDNRVVSYESKVDSTIVIRISAVGDLMCHSVQIRNAQVGVDTFDFKKAYRKVEKYFNESDFLIGNLETVLAGKEKKFTGYPLFNSPDDFAVALKQVGFDLLVTSNNHSLDRGEFGVHRTIDQLIANDLIYIGTHKSRSDRDSIRIVNINGIRIAFLAYTFGTNGIPIPKGKDFLVNLIDKKKIERDIKSARNVGTDLVLIYYHFGDEYKREPSSYQKNIVQFSIDNGADIIIGSHPHVIQPIKYFNTKNAKLDSGLVAFSLGNFISNQQWRYSDAGIILNIDLEKNIFTNDIRIKNFHITPTWVFRGKTDKGVEHLILSESTDYKNILKLTTEEKRRKIEAFEDTREVVGRKID